MDDRELFNCNECLYFTRCDDCECMPCESDAECEEAIEYIKENTKPVNNKWMSRGRYYDDYYVDFINSALFEIRDGLITQLFNLGQVCDILRYEPRADIFSSNGDIYARI